MCQPHRSGPYLRAAARRRQLLDATGRLFDRSGFGGITMAGAAAEAGVSRQLVYDHFGDLDTLYESFVEDRLARYRATLPDISALDLDDAAATMFRHLLTIPPTDRRVVRLLVADVGLRGARPSPTAVPRRRARPLAQPGTDGRHAARASAVIWTTTSALLALADAVTTGDITETEATRMAVGIVRSTSMSPPVNE